MYSAKSKARGGKLAIGHNIAEGDLVFIKSEGDKFHMRPQYIVTHRSGDLCTLKKMNKGKFMSRSLELPAQDLYKVQKSSSDSPQKRCFADEESSDDDFDLQPVIPQGQPLVTAPTNQPDA